MSDEKTPVEDVVREAYSQGVSDGHPLGRLSRIPEELATARKLDAERAGLLAAAVNAVEWCCGLKGEKNLAHHHCEACAPLIAAIARAEGR